MLGTPGIWPGCCTRGQIVAVTVPDAATRAARIWSAPGGRASGSDLARHRVSSCCGTPGPSTPGTGCRRPGRDGTGSAGGRQGTGWQLDVGHVRHFTVVAGTSCARRTSRHCLQPTLPVPVLPRPTPCQRPNHNRQPHSDKGHDAAQTRAPSHFAQQMRSNSAPRTHTNHHTPALRLWWNALLREG